MDNDSLQALLQIQRQAQAQSVPSYRQRIADIKALKRLIKMHQDAIVSALSDDFGNRSDHESLLADCITLMQECDHTCAHLRQWMRPQTVSVGWQFWPGRAEIRYQPLGVVGILAPWNYPVNLLLAPLICALAAGNHAMLKPSEHTPKTGALLKKLLADIFPESRVAVVEGGPEVAAAFTALKFDHIFFTGSTTIGKQVALTAAENLVPVTLELGGKSPAIIDEDYSITTAANRIVSGKYFNCGQTCIAPDYVLVPEHKMADFVGALKTAIKRAFPAFEQNPDYTLMINQAAAQRMHLLLQDARDKGCEVWQAEAVSKGDSRLVPPALVINPGADTRVMMEEIFGPVLPVIAVKSLDDALGYVNAGDRPLSLYYFGHHPARVERVLAATTSGSVAVNDCLVQFVINELPFGGVGASGLGRYHGHAGFSALSHAKSIYRQSRLTSFSLLSPPYGKVANILLKVLGK